MKQDFFERTVQEALSELPRELRKALKTVQIVIQDAPRPEDLERSGLSSDGELYGLFDGLALGDKTVTNEQAFPDRVILYRRSLEADFPDLGDLRREIRVTLIHELGHFFGFDEDDLEKRGWG
jgi:predicted Zn-dependent protease with MMP-like domain